MSESKTLADKLKSAPAATSLLDLSTLCVNASGMLQKTYSAVPTRKSPICEDADSALPGWMRTVQSTLNLPPGTTGNGSFLLTMQWDAVAKMQLFFYWSAPMRVYARKRNSGGANNGMWDPWVRFLSESN